MKTRKRNRRVAAHSRRVFAVHNLPIVRICVCTLYTIVICALILSIIKGRRRQTGSRVHIRIIH